MMRNMDNERDWFFALDGDFIYLDEYEEYACTGRLEKDIYGRAFLLEDGRVVVRHEDGSDFVKEFPNLDAAKEEYTIY